MPLAPRALGGQPLHPPRSRSEDLYEPISHREYRESLYDSPFPHGALLLPFSCCNMSWLILHLRLLRYCANYFVTKFYDVRIAGPTLMSVADSGRLPYGYAKTAAQTSG